MDQSTQNQPSLNQSTANESAQNQRHLRRLVMALKASYGQLNLLIAICDNWHYRDQLIDRYERELKAENVQCNRLTLDRQHPSLKHSLQGLLETIPNLTPPTIVTILGADELLGIRLDAAKSAQEHFFFSLQWTREGLRDFNFPIVLWLTPPIAAELAQNAPDFWSWRGGVFEFSQPLSVQYATFTKSFALKPLPDPQPDRFVAHIQDLKQQIQDLEHQDPSSPLLGSLYHSLGDIHKEAHHYEEAKAAYGQSLSLREKHLGLDHPDTATSLNNLAHLYHNMGRYSEAEPLYKRSLSIVEEQLGADHTDTAQSLNNLAALYYSQGRYSEAEPLYKRSLSICEQQLGAADHPDTAQSLNGLAVLYYAQGRYSEAEPLLKRSLSICEQQLEADHPDTAQSLNNLAALYDAQGRYSEAEVLYVRAIEISLQALGQDHPNTQTFISNFIGCVQQAIQAGQRGQLSGHPLTQNILATIDRGEL